MAMASPSSPNSNKLNKPKQKLKHVKSLGKDLLSSRTHSNNLPVLLSFITPNSPPQYVVESLLSLQSFFTPLLPTLPSSNKRNTDVDDDDADVIYKTWLRSKFDELIKLLIDVVVSTLAEDTLKEIVVDALMDFVKIANGGKFHSAIYQRLLHSVVYSATTIDFFLELFTSKYFKYVDIRYFTYVSLEKFAATMKDEKLVRAAGENDSNSSMEQRVRNIHDIISNIPPLEDLKEDSASEMWSGSGFSAKEGNSKDLSEVPKTEEKQTKSSKLANSVLSASSIAKKMKSRFTKAWISFLRLNLPLDVYKEVLVSLHLNVVPYLANPKILCDFLTRSYDVGGVVSVMALSSLFILITQHGVEYPNFYGKLYALLLPSTFMAKHRAKFFELLDSCLKSSLLPAYLAAAFAKKLSRLALVVPPSGSLVIIALIHNLLRRHPSINCLVHREDRTEASNANSEAEGEKADQDSQGGSDASYKTHGIDHFNNKESNPVKTKALRSSLWEVDTLRHHYCPPVSRFVLSLENDLTVRAKTTEVDVKDFSSGSYATIFGAEIRRRVKQVPLAFYKTTPTSLFSDSDFSGWTFQHDESNMMNDTKRNTTDDDDHSSAKRQKIEC